jgi:hypothetical protein
MTLEIPLEVEGNDLYLKMIASVSDDPPGLLLPGGGNADRIKNACYNFTMVKYVGGLAGVKQNCKKIFEKFVSNDLDEREEAEELIRDLIKKLNDFHEFPLSHRDGWDETMMQFVFTKAHEFEEAKKTAAAAAVALAQDPASEEERKMQDLVQKLYHQNDKVGSYWDIPYEAVTIIPSLPDFNLGGYGDFKSLTTTTVTCDICDATDLALTGKGKINIANLRSHLNTPVHKAAIAAARKGAEAMANVVEAEFLAKGIDLSGTDFLAYKEALHGSETVAKFGKRKRDSEGSDTIASGVGTANATSRQTPREPSQ